MRTRILELDDPQLTPQTVDETRDCLGEAILLIHARVAVRAAERGNVALRNSTLPSCEAPGWNRISWMRPFASR